MKRLDWDDLARGHADACDGQEVEIAGWMAPPDHEPVPDYFLLSCEPPGCCLPTDPLGCVEVFAASGVTVEAGKTAFRGVWRVLEGDPTGWRFQLVGARPTKPVTRRRILAGGVIAGLIGGARTALAMSSGAADRTDTETVTPAAPVAVSDQARAVLAATVTVDLHSHAGSITGVKRVTNGGPLTPLAAPMRQGGMRVVCLAIVSDSPTHHVESDHRIHPYRDPDPGELYAYGNKSFERVHALIHSDGLAVLRDRAAIGAARADAPSIIVTAEGADFLEGRIERVDEAYEKWGLRHLQLTHYRVNELGDIQTEKVVHGGLTDFGAEVIKRCNARGIVVDIAHGTYDLVKRAAAVTTKPLILSHTSYESAPRPFSRTIDADHAKLVAATGGVIGIWPPASRFPDLAALAGGMAEMVDHVGIDHVGLGTDSMGLVGPSIFDDYARLPELAQALLDHGFHADEAGKLLGGNYRRVFEASLA